jgi:hypothetical protein
VPQDSAHDHAFCQSGRRGDMSLQHVSSAHWGALALPRRYGQEHQEHIDFTANVFDLCSVTSNHATHCHPMCHREGGAIVTGNCRDLLGKQLAIHQSLRDRARRPVARFPSGVVALGVWGGICKITYPTHILLPLVCSLSCEFVQRRASVSEREKLPGRGPDALANPAHRRHEHRCSGSSSEWRLRKARGAMGPRRARPTGRGPPS